MQQDFRQYEDPARNRDYFVYEASVTALAVGANATDTIQIQADADFIWQKASYECDIAGATKTPNSRTIPNVLIQITDTGSNRRLFFNPVPIETVFGIGALPFILTNPRLFMQTSVIQIDFTSFEAVVTPTVRLSFIGYKLYKFNT